MAFQATMELMADNFPGAFAGYRLEVTESHQRTKVDTSGTAKAVVESFRKLGAPFSEARARGLRTPALREAPKPLQKSCCALFAGCLRCLPPSTTQNPRMGCRMPDEIIWHCPPAGCFATFVY